MKDPTTKTIEYTDNYYKRDKMNEQEELYVRAKCPDCEWSQFRNGEAVGMTLCLSCNSTGYIYKPYVKRDLI